MTTKERLQKTIIVDFDDTLCIHPENDKSNIINGKPNIPLIEKLNECYDNGYYIEIYTARGHFSAKSREDAREKYKQVIYDWLFKHNVKFNRLDFNKPYGIMYIDDKAIKPNELELVDSLLS